MRISKHGAQSIRAELVADREKRDTYSQRRVNFGIYRLVDPVSTLLLTESMRTALEDTLPGIRSERQHQHKKLGSFSLNTVMAGTFVQRSVIGKKSLELMKAGFSVARNLKPLGRELAEAGDKVVVEIDPDSVRWDDRGGSGRKLIVGILPDEQQHYRLVHEAAIVARHLPASVKVQAPDHISLGQYGTKTDGCNLTKKQKDTIALAVAEEFDDAGPSLVTFNEFQIGNSYTESLEEWREVRYTMDALIEDGLSRTTSDGVTPKIA